MSHVSTRSSRGGPALRAGRPAVRLGRALAAVSLALVLAACTAPAPQAPTRVDGAVDGTAGAPAAAPAPSSSPTAPAVVDTPTGKAGAEPAAMPAPPDRSCRTDSDCAVKDVGNCCGYFPMCVNKNAQTDPVAVRAACEREGMASVCGFQEVKGCRCVENRCDNLRDGLPEAM